MMGKIGCFTVIPFFVVLVALGFIRVIKTSRLISHNSPKILPKQHTHQALHNGNKYHEYRFFLEYLIPHPPVAQKNPFRKKGFCLSSHDLIVKLISTGHRQRCAHTATNAQGGYPFVHLTFLHFM